MTKPDDAIRVLHITDMHLRWHQPGTADRTERLSREMPAVLERLADRLDEFVPDVIVFTGDLLDVPDPVVAGDVEDADVLAEALEQAEADYRLVRDRMLAMKTPFVVIPGNHDVVDLVHKVFPESAPVIDHAGIRFVSFCDDLDDARTPIRSGAEADLFETVLADPEHDLPQIHLQHYMVEPPTFMRSQYDYSTSRAMAPAIDKSNRVVAVLSGHYHPGSLFMGPSGVCYSVVPAICSVPHPVRLMDIRPSGGIHITDSAVDAV